MTLYELFRYPCRRRYYSPLLSKATFVSFGFLIVSILVSLILAYTTQGFFVLENNIMESPVVDLLEGSIFTVMNTDTKTLIYTVNDNLSFQYKSSLRIPTASFSTVDSNKDSLIDSFVVNLEYTMNDNEPVNSFQFFIGFKYILQRLSQIDLEDYIYMEYSGGSNTASVDMIGYLEFNQKSPLNYKNYQLLGLPVANPSNLNEILFTYGNRDVSLTLSDKTVTWENGRNSSQAFKVKVTINVKQAYLVYKPGFWYTLKWAWIQFASIAVFGFYLQQYIKEYLFSNNIVATVRQESDLHLMSCSQCDDEGLDLRMTDKKTL